MIYKISAARKAALMKADGGVILFYHCHQPPAVRPGTLRQDQPSARVNALRGYHGMLAWAGARDIRATFNFSPSLIEQLELYSQGGTDIFLEHTKVAAKKLTAEQKAFILSNFFTYNDEDWAIKPWPRYRELLEKRNKRAEFTNQDFLDLQVWFNLGMFGHSLRQESSEVRALIEKGRHYTEADKRRVIEIQLGTIAKLLKSYRDMQDSGKISVTVSPYAHPIIPLIIDQRIALERTGPGAWLPQFSHPDDARAQLHLAGIIYERTFGRPPLGMWPSEGAVCQEMLPLIRQAIPSVRYLFTDVDIWNRSQPSSKSWWARFQPWEAGGLNFFFRDRQLSDDYGYVVMMRHEKTAFEMYQNAGRIIDDAKAAGLPQPVVPLVLDGDNFQRSRMNDGFEFVDLLYRFLSGYQKDSKAEAPEHVATMLPEEYLALHPRSPQLTRLAAGTWMDDFSTWTGHLHSQEYSYWRVHRAEWMLENLEREFAINAGPRRRAQATAEIYSLAARHNLFAAYKELSPLAQAYLLILQAESSCFRWWFAGKAAEMADLGAFDRQYRQLLADGYRALGLQVPAEVYQTLYPERDWAAAQPKIE